MNMKNLLKNVDYKGLAMQHCEKVVIVVVTVLLVFFLWNGVNKAMSASDITPDQIAKLAGRLKDSVDNSKWESSPDRDTVKNPDFDVQIKQLKDPVDSKQFKLSAPFYFNFVDFGGVMRQKPEVLKPYNSIAFSDRGAVSLYKADSKGNIIEKEVISAAPKKKAPDEDEPKKKAKAAPTKTAKAKGGQKSGAMSGMPMGMGGGEGDSMADDMMGMSGGMAGMYGRGQSGQGRQGAMSMSGGAEMGSEGMSGNIGASQKKSGGSIRNNRKPDEDDQFADEPPPGKGAGAPPGAKVDPAKAPVARKVPVQEIRGIRWAVVTALYPHREQVQEYRNKLHTPNDPPVYKMVMVERREVLSDGSLSEWASIDLKKEAEIVKLMPEKKRTPERPEFLAANAVFAGLLMPLPDLVAGRWTFHNQKAASLAALEAAEKGGAGGGMEGESDGTEGEQSQEQLNEGIFSGGAAGGPMPRSAGVAGIGGGRGGDSSGGAVSGGPGRGMSDQINKRQEMGGRFAGNQGIGRAPAAGANQPGTAKAKAAVKPCHAEVVQIRFIDYTVEPEHTYQYRLKVVVENPNFNRIDTISEDVAKDETLTSENWCEPTNPIFVPTDTEYFVLERIRARDREEAKLQVHKWLADLGDWQLSDFTIKPGDPIGAEVPDYKMVDWEDKLTKTRFDFSTQDLLLDVTGGEKQFTFTVDGVEIKYSEKLPAEIFVIDRLGDLATRNEDFDKHNADRKERETEIKKLRDAAEKEPKKGAANKPETGGSADDFDKRLPGERKKEN